MRIALIVFLFLISNYALAQSRRGQKDREFSYFIYPVWADIPGIGSTLGGGITLANIHNDIDATALYSTGDFDGKLVSFSSFHLIPDTVTFGIGLYSTRMPRSVFARGIESSRESYFLDEVKEEAGLAYLRYFPFGQTLVLYTYGVDGRLNHPRLFSSTGTSVTNPDTSFPHFQKARIGITLDLTDHSSDPRAGIRAEYLQKRDLISQFRISNSYVNDYNITGYIPIGTKHTWAFNYFASNAVVTSQDVTDPATLNSDLSFNCATTADPARCNDVQAKYIEERVATNSFGRATSLGGTQRLRSFPTGRFTAGNTLFAGTEFRFNLNEENTPMNWIFWKGIRTGFQAAAFAEFGTVNDDISKLHNGPFKKSYGLGFRVVFTGTVLRADYATGDEGSQLQLFVNYPWNAFSIDSF